MNGQEFPGPENTALTVTHMASQTRRKRRPRRTAICNFQDYIDTKSAAASLDLTLKMVVCLVVNNFLLDPVVGTIVSENVVAAVAADFSRMTCTMVRRTIGTANRKRCGLVSESSGKRVAEKCKLVPPRIERGGQKRKIRRM